jgi:hypothetical protein
MTVQNKLENGRDLQRLQETFLGLDLASDDDMGNTAENKGEEDDDEEQL